MADLLAQPILGCTPNVDNVEGLDTLSCRLLNLPPPRITELHKQFIEKASGADTEGVVVEVIGVDTEGVVFEASGADTELVVVGCVD